MTDKTDERLQGLWDNYNFIVKISLILSNDAEYLAYNHSAIQVK